MAADRNDTPWQQGSVLSAERAKEIGILHAYSHDDVLAIVISHDCDLVEASDIEPNCEVLIGRKIAKVDGTFSKGKNPRRLHLEFSAGQFAVSAEFTPDGKTKITKTDLFRDAPASEILLSRDEHFTLQSWLSNRYHRPIYPDEFDRRLKAKPVEIQRRLETIIKATGSDLIAVLFDVDSNRMVERQSDEDTYSLSIYLLYDVSVDPTKAEATAKEAAGKIRNVFRQFLFAKGKWKQIELREAISVSEDAMTVYQWRSLKPWHFGYVNLANR